MKIVTASEMRRLDQRAVGEYGIPVRRLMESAGEAVVAVLRERFAPLRFAGVVCGMGNNGGDGFVAARLLKRMGVRVAALLAGDPLRLPSEPRRQYDRARAVGVRFRTRADAAAVREALSDCDVIVDALFGTGLSRPLTGEPLAIVRAINRIGRPVVSVDVPSGMSADDGSPRGDSIRAAITVTFGLPKLGFYTTEGRARVGTVVTADIGFPRELLDDAAFRHAFPERAEIRGLLPRYGEDIHKGTRGRLIVAAGSAGLSGAAALCATAAQRIGAGLVTVACPRSLNPILEVKLTEPMTAPMPETADGGLTERALGSILRLASRADAAVVGPGLGRHPRTARLLTGLLPRLPVPVVLDADALNLLGGRPSRLKVVKAPVLLTPHPGEAARLLRTDVAAVERDRVRVAKEIARGYNAVVVLKGHQTVVADPRGQVRLNPTGNRALATAGTGDVLSGVIGGLLAQRLSPFDAAVAGVYLHGLAGERASRRIGLDGVLAGDLLPILPRVLRDLRGGD